jgi:hypothetical protein
MAADSLPDSDVTAGAPSRARVGLDHGLAFSDRSRG